MYKAMATCSTTCSISFGFLAGHLWDSEIETLPANEISVSVSTYSYRRKG